MAYTSADLDSLDRAISSGVLTVRYAGKERTFRSVDELIKARAHIAAQLSGATSGRIRHSLARFDDDD
jgi:hypothetical protein